MCQLSIIISIIGAWVYYASIYLVQAYWVKSHRYSLLERLVHHEIHCAELNGQCTLTEHAEYIEIHVWNQIDQYMHRKYSNITFLHKIFIVMLFINFNFILMLLNCII